MGQTAPSIPMQVAGTQSMTNISTAPNSTTLPIRVNLDFSDQKSQQLFIFEQKYNMKKNDCFNVERQRDKLDKQLQTRNLEYKEL